ncbi:MAG: serine hydrolase [Planctomycetota bacterium]
MNYKNITIKIETKRQLIVFLLVLLLGIFLFVAGLSLWPKKEYITYVTFESAVESIASKKSLPPLPEPVKPKDLKIVSAQYGAKDQWFDVTKQLQDKIDDNQLSIYSSNNLAGDPLYGYPKELKVEYILDGVKKNTRVREGRKLEIPPKPDPNDALRVIERNQELIKLAEQCPGEVGFYGVNFTTGKTVEYRGNQPACMASIVKIFVLLEVMRQAEEGTVDLSESVVIERGVKKETCSVSEAIDKMIGISDNEATGTLAKLVGYSRVNALAKELSIEGISNNILPEPGALDGVLDKRVYELRDVPKTELLPQHGTAKGIVQYFRLLNEKKLINESISRQVLEVMERNPKYSAPRATPEDYKSVGKGGSIVWKRPIKTQYNMVGWGLYIYNDKEALSFCLWFEWFPEDMSENERSEWTSGISDCIVNLLLQPEFLEK